MNTERITDFAKFLEKQLLPGIDELEKLSDGNRKHVQKLVYTNLVDRFDNLVDKLILDNCREEQLVSKAFDGNDKPVTESDLIKLLLNSADLQSALDTRLQDKLRLSVLRQRHSRKLSSLLGLSSDIGEFDKKPRVNPSTGEIAESFKIQIKTMPHSICGYADWLYSRRNAIVHGAGVSVFLENDKVQIKKLYNVDTKKTFKISTSSIRLASTYYRAVCDLMK
ncbi:MAG: Uncharacterized protein FD138_492 [Planctomycetota bacterium]|nr:MAG: Uncharacterized protein FD138_492 [Planctomycetota bacterium]